jgi:hypothetical protein
MLRNELVPVDHLVGERPARSGEVKRLVVLEFESEGARIEVAARAEHRALVAGAVTTTPVLAPRTAAPV